MTQPPTIRADTPREAGHDETAWLIEETWSGHVHYIHRDFDALAWRDEANSLSSRPYEWARNGGGVVLIRRGQTIPFITKDAAVAMRFPTRDAAEAWLNAQPRWISHGDQYQTREHLWPRATIEPKEQADGR